MRWVLVVSLALVGGCTSKIAGCMPDAGESCKCTAADTVRDCVDKNGNAGLEYCTGGNWSNCAIFGDGGNTD